MTMQVFDNDQIARRFEELEHLEGEGVVAYPYSFNRTHTTAEARDGFVDDAPEQTVGIAGRIVAIRKMGKASFIHLQDDVSRLQIYLKRDDLENYEHLRLYDIGDIIGVTGFMFRTRTGEVTLHAKFMMLLTKCLTTLPVPKMETDADGNQVLHDQFTDKELRYRQRYIDLAVNPEIRETFRKRARIISTIRRFLDERGYLEVETPVLHSMYGGAAARPFATHLNALNIPLFLRISLELNLKRLMVGGFNGVYELGKNFRNEGMDRTHNPEFTMLELYVAYNDYNWMAELVEQMLAETVKAVNGSLVVTAGDGVEIDFTPPYRRATMHQLISEHTGRDIEGMDLDALRALAREKGIHTDGTMGVARVIDELFSTCVQPNVIQPTFVMDYPEEMVPLAKRHRTKPGLVEAWELIIKGQEMAPAFSELNDPRDQRRRFQEQARLREAGDDEAMLIDEDFLHALEVGMPPCTGMGLGIDRLTMLLTGQDSIRDVIFFPMMRPDERRAHAAAHEEGEQA
ncbi:MAG: lysine--tRNA ligase [Bacteroidetes bacterium]|nr:lysine--tRNA ligase [Bacteroidota bacterium]